MEFSLFEFAFNPQPAKHDLTKGAHLTFETLLCLNLIMPNEKGSNQNFVASEDWKKEKLNCDISFPLFWTRSLKQLSWLVQPSTDPHGFVIHSIGYVCQRVHSLKLTYPLKMIFSKRNLLFQGFIFRGYVNFREGKMSKKCLVKRGSLEVYLEDRLPGLGEPWWSEKTPIEKSHVEFGHLVSGSHVARSLGLKITMVRIHPSMRHPTKPFINDMAFRIRMICP